MTEKTLIAEFREFRKEAGLETVTRYLPRNFSGGMADLDELYHLNAARAEEQESRAQAQLMMHKEMPSEESDYVTRQDLEEHMRFLGEQHRKLEERLAAAMVWASAWREGEKYKTGDVVQHGGALYICKATNTEAKPGSGPGWQLMVKRVA